MGKKKYYWKGLGCVIHKGKKLDPEKPLPESLGKDFFRKHHARGEIEIRDYSVVKDVDIDQGEKKPDSNPEIPEQPPEPIDDFDDLDDGRDGGEKDGGKKK